LAKAVLCALFLLGSKDLLVAVIVRLLASMRPTACAPHDFWRWAGEFGFAMIRA